MPKCFVVVGFLFTIKLFHVVAFSSSSMLCLGRMFLIPFEAHSFALPPPKQCAAGNKWFFLVDNMLVSLLLKQSAAGNKCFSLADNLLALPPPKQSAAGNKWFFLAAHLLASLSPLVLWFRQWEWLCRDFCVPWAHKMAAKIYRKHSACGMKFVETCHEGCLKKLPPHKSEGASLTWMSFYLLNQMLITTEID